MLSLTSALKWKLVIVIAFSALIGSAITITTIKIIGFTENKCPIVEKSTENTFRRGPPINTGRDKEF